MNKNSKDEKLETLSERLVYVLDVLGVTQAELARRIEVKPQVIHYLCNSRSKKSSFTYEIAEALKINGNWLGCGKGVMRWEEDSVFKDQKCIPLVDIRHAYHLVRMKTINTNVPVKDRILTNSVISETAFAIQLHDKSMFPRFDQMTIIIIDPKRPRKESDFIVVYLKEQDDVVFRQYEIENNVEILKPMNIAMYKIIKKNKDDIILGIMAEARWKN